MNVGAIIVDPKFFCPYFLARRLRVSKEHVGLYTVETETSSTIDEHVNIRTLVARMDHAFENNDYSNVLHASASIFETMAKDIIGSPIIQDKTLKSFFDRYRADSKLPNEVLDYIVIPKSYCRPHLHFRRVSLLAAP